MDNIKWIDDAIERAKDAVWLDGHERALEWLRPLLFDEPGYGRLHLALAEILHQHADDLKTAEGHYRMAIRFDPKLVLAYQGLSDILSDDERHTEAIRICKDGLRHCKSNRSILMTNIGRSWELRQRYRKAIRHYRRALRQSAQLWDCKVLEESIMRCKRKQR